MINHLNQSISYVFFFVIPIMVLQSIHPNRSISYFFRSKTQRQCCGGQGRDEEETYIYISFILNASEHYLTPNPIVRLRHLYTSRY
jgi:hypothetical protein